MSRPVEFSNGLSSMVTVTKLSTDLYRILELQSIASRVAYRPLSDTGTPCFGLWNPEFVVIHRTLDPPFQIIESNNSSNSSGYQSPILLSSAVDNMLYHLSAEGDPQWLRSTTSSYTKAST